MTNGPDDLIRIRPGRIRDRGRSRKDARQLLGMTQHAASALGNRRSLGAPSFAARSFKAGLRRVIVKARVVRQRGGISQGVGRHLAYIGREGVDRTGEPGRAYDAGSDDADTDAFARRCHDDRHHFRFIVSPEDGERLQDLKPLVRDLMAAAERDLGTGLDWVAVDHYDTGRPHSHIILRGKREDGRDLVIRRDYMSHGFRMRAAELVTLELGPETAHEIRVRLVREVDAERFTSLDRTLLKHVRENRIALADLHGRKNRLISPDLMVRRLHRLEALKLTRSEGQGVWRLRPDLETALKRLGERGDIIKFLHRALKDRGIAARAKELDLPARDMPAGHSVVGRVLAVTVTDELHDRSALVLGTLGGRLRAVTLPTMDPDIAIREGMIVRLSAPATESRTVDRTIHEIARAERGLYSAATHRHRDPAASDDFIDAHVRRLEALRRSGLVERLPTGSWLVPDGYPEKAAAYDRRRDKEPTLHILSPRPLQDLVEIEAATWLDRQLAGEDKATLPETNFGKEVREALAARRRWLITQGLAREADGVLTADRRLLDRLTRMELARVSDALKAETGKAVIVPKDGEHIDGVYRRPLQLVSGRFAILENEQGLTIAPWRPFMDKYRGRALSGTLQRGRVNWQLMRGREMER